jgi:hypothetical protein
MTVVIVIQAMSEATNTVLKHKFMLLDSLHHQFYNMQ